MDNMYMVTVVATDDGTPKMTAMRDVVITVTNADEDRLGNLLLSPAQGRTALHRIPLRPRRRDDGREVGVDENI